MATATVSEATPEQQKNTLPAITDWSDDKQWEALDGLLPVGVWRRLAVTNRALYASNHIAEMLARDARGKDDAEDNKDIVYDGLSCLDVEALRLAQVELGSRAEECLAEIRDNELGCFGKRA
jgi:hypothetical protein